LRRKLGLDVEPNQVRMKKKWNVNEIAEIAFFWPYETSHD
jgi:hypothetical protein